MSCANCDALLTKYNQSIKDCERLLDKLRDYQGQLDQCEAWISDHTRRSKDAVILHESLFKALLARLSQLASSDNNNNNEDTTRLSNHYVEPTTATNTRRSIAVESMQLMSDTLIQVYKTLKIKEFESKYEPNLSTLIRTIACKQDGIAQTPIAIADSNNNNIMTTNAPSPQLKITMAIHQELNEYKAKSLLCKEKLNQQKQLIQNLLNKMSSSGVRSTANQSACVIGSSQRGSNEENNHHYVSSETTSTTSSSCTSNSSSFQASHQQRLSGESGIMQETYQCPKCQVQIDSSKITLKKLESHVKKCDTSKLVCIFCLKLYEQTEMVLFENHVQKHLLKQTLVQQQQLPVDNKQQQNMNTTTTSAMTTANVATFSTINNNSI